MTMDGYTKAEKNIYRLEILKVVIAFLNPLILLFVGAFIGIKIDSYQDYSIIHWKNVMRFIMI